MKYQTRAHLSHLGVILSNISIALLLYSVFAMFSGIFGVFIPIIGFFLWGVAVLFSIGLLLLSPEFMAIPEKLGNIISSIGDFSQVILNTLPYSAGIGLALSIASTVFLLFEPSANKHYGRISVTVITVGLLIAVLIGIIITAVGGGA